MDMREGDNPCQQMQAQTCLSTGFPPSFTVFVTAKTKDGSLPASAIFFESDTSLRQQVL
jgi:hypothetical protein